MAKVWCATIECKHNKNNQCKAKEINISDGHIHTVHQGYKQIWLCRSFTMSEAAMKMEKALKKAMQRIMANEKRLIEYVDREEVCRLCDNKKEHCGKEKCPVYKAPTVDAVEVVRCQNCIHAEPLDHNCELSTSHYMHCKLWRGEETKNVWHKYKKYYKDYSLVERDGYCDAGAKIDGVNEDG